jgi:hypothetical protein
MEFSPLPLLHPPWVQIFPLSTMFSNTLSLLRSSLNVRDQISHPHRMSSKATVLCISTCMFFGIIQEDKIFWSGCGKHLANLNCHSFPNIWTLTHFWRNHYLQVCLYYDLVLCSDVKTGLCTYIIFAGILCRLWNAIILNVNSDFYICWAQRCYSYFVLKIIKYVCLSFSEIPSTKQHIKFSVQSFNIYGCLSEEIIWSWTECEEEEEAHSC